MIRQSILAGAVATLAIALHGPPAFSDTLDDLEMDDEMAGLVFEMMGVQHCMLPPPDISAQEFAALAEEMAAPLTGTVETQRSGIVAGDGVFKPDGDEGGFGVMLSAGVIIDDSDLMAMCMVLAPIGDTTQTDTQATLVTDAPDEVEQPAYIAVTRLYEHDGEDFAPVGVLAGPAGDITLEMTDMSLQGELTLTGAMGALAGAADDEGTLALSFNDLIHEESLRVVTLEE